MIARILVFALLIVSSTPTLPAQIARDSARLAEVVVTAHRDSSSPRVRASAADLLTSQERVSRGLHRLSDALRQVPGAALVATGAPGGVASAFLRGVNSNQTLMMIDGIRVTDANTPAQALLGGFQFGGNDRLEIVRGPQGTLYGGAAIGGVIAIMAEPTVGDRLTSDLEAGRFATYQGRLHGSLTRGRWSAAFTSSFADSDHQRPENRYDQRGQSLAVAFRPTGHLEFGLTARGQQSSFTSPGDIRSTNTTPTATTEFDHLLATLYASSRVTRRWSTRLTLGRQAYWLEGRSRFNGGDEFISQLKSNRWVLDWQHRLTISDRVRLIAGASGEWMGVTDPDSDRDEGQRAGYAELSASPTDDLGLSIGMRRDDYDSYGGSTTGRLAVGYFVPAARLKLRGTVGTGFLPPSLAARHGGPFQRANPTIKAEASRGWDVGVDRFFANDRGVVSLTYFGNALRDLIGFESAEFPALGRAVNIAEARTRGLEISGRVAADRLDVRAGYTFLEADDLSAGTSAERRLIRRPKHSWSFDLGWHRDRLTLGAGAFAALDREDSDFAQFPAPRVNPGDFVDASLRAGWRLGPSLALRGRLDNLFNERYEEVYGFPALGRRFLVGITLGATR